MAMNIDRSPFAMAASVTRATRPLNVPGRTESNPSTKSLEPGPLLGIPGIHMPTAVLILLLEQYIQSQARLVKA
ncbi:MAG: hypothetical protein IT537_10135 [Hyphomicrobiales bacterium]|nr:hypothetical protein [Hyphomicrobiales bacterium]